MTENAYLVGLRLAGKKAVVIGGGTVAQRRVPILIGAGADVHVIARAATPAVEALSEQKPGITLQLRDYRAGDLEGAWYAIAATDDPAVIAAVPGLAHEFDRGTDGFEYQMLYGIRDGEQRRLAEAGNHVRVYVPFGSEWYGYFVRRLAERPANLMFFLRALAQRR